MNNVLHPFLGPRTFLPRSGGFFSETARFKSRFGFKSWIDSQKIRFGSETFYKDSIQSPETIILYTPNVSQQRRIPVYANIANFNINCNGMETTVFGFRIEFPRTEFTGYSRQTGTTNTKIALNEVYFTFTLPLKNLAGFGTLQFVSDNTIVALVWIRYDAQSVFRTKV